MTNFSSSVTSFDRRKAAAAAGTMQADLLTETVVPIVGQTETVVACAPVISWDVDALMDTASVVLSRALIDICREIKK